MRRVFAIVLIVLGLATIGAAVASGTVWRPADTVTLQLPSTPDAPLVVTEPGVLETVADDVQVRVVGASEDTPLVLAMGREDDVREWVGDTPYLAVTGLADWETLATEEVTGAPSEDATSEDGNDAPAVTDPAGSDLWVEQVTGTGELSYTWASVPGRWMMIVAGDGTEPAPQVELTWSRDVTTPFVQPGIILGSVVLLIGLVLLVMQLLVSGEARRARHATGEIPVTPALVTASGDRPLTRREMRLAQAGAAASTSPAGTADEPGTESEAVDAATAGPGDAADDDASRRDELAAWVSGGSRSPLPDESGPATEVLPPVQEDGDSRSATAGSEEATGADEATGAEQPPARRFWRRVRGARAEAETAPTLGETLPAVGVEPAVAEPTEDEAAEPESSPQSSGASWRQTWGLGVSSRIDEQEEDR